MTNIIKNRNAVPAPFGSVLDQLFPNKVGTLLDDAIWGVGSPVTAAIAPANIWETASTYEIELAAPGCSKSDFHIKIDGDTLRISFDQSGDSHPADHTNEYPSGQKADLARIKWIRREFMYPSFRRHFELSETIDRDKISACYDNGILFLTLPKKENLTKAPRQISIS